jgi:hypothetical protein
MKRKTTQRDADRAREEARKAMAAAEAGRKTRNLLSAPDAFGGSPTVQPPAAPEAVAPVVREGKTDQLNVRVTASLLGELRTMARKHQVSVAAIVEAGCKHQVEKLRNRPAPPAL